MVDISRIVSAGYLFESRPEPDSTLLLVLAGGFCLSLIGSGVVWLALARRAAALPPLESVRSRLTNLLFMSGLIGLFLVFFRWQGIPFMGSRIWLVLWLVVIVAWLVRLGFYLLKKFPNERRLFVSKRLYERYLPRTRQEKRG